MKARFVFVSSFIVLALSVFGEERKAMNVFVKVVDEQSSPVTNAYVIGGSEGVDTYVSKKVNKEGVAVFRDATKRKAFDPQIIAPGYYKSEGCYITNVRLPGADREFIVTLRKVINPVPIETKAMDYLIGNTFDKDIGLDLKVLDWTPPYGSGANTDLVVRASWERISDNRDWHSPPIPGLRSIITLHAFGAGNGFLPFIAERVNSGTLPGSVFMPPHQVPLTGLTNQICFVSDEYDAAGRNYSETENKHYVFRVRTEYDRTGTILKSHVGWLEGPIAAGVTYSPDQSARRPHPKPSELMPERFCLKFIRHCNPDPTSNSLEPNTPVMRWENEISHLIRRFKLQDMPWVKELQPLDRNDPQWIPSPEEMQAERKAKEEERMKAARAAARASREKHFREDPKAAERYFEIHPEERALYDLNPKAK